MPQEGEQAVTVSHLLLGQTVTALTSERSTNMTHIKTMVLAALCVMMILLSIARGQHPEGDLTPEELEAARREMLGNATRPFDKDKHLQEVRERLKQAQPDTPQTVLTPAEAIVQEYRTAKTMTARMSALQELLQRDDLTDELRIYALWRVGALYSYNADPANGWPYNPNKAAESFYRALAVQPGLVCFETINAAVTLATMPGTPMQRAERLADGYKWLRTRTHDMIYDSSQRLDLPSVPEGILGKKFFPGTGVPALSPEERQLALAGRLERATEIMDKWVPYFVKNEDPIAVSHALTKLEKIAPPEKLATWRRMLQSENRFTDATAIINQQISNIDSFGPSAVASQSDQTSSQRMEDSPESSGRAPNEGGEREGADASIRFWLIVVVAAAAGIFVGRYGLRILHRRQGQTRS